MIFLGIDGHAACGDDLERLQGIALHDDVLWRPVGTCNGVFVLVALVLGRLDGTRLQPDLDFSDVVRLLHPQVYEVDLGIASDHEQISARGGIA